MRTQKNVTKNNDTKNNDTITTTPEIITMPDPKTAQPKTFSVTLSAPGAKLVLLAMRKADGSAMTTATTTDLNTKKSQRGVTARHANFEVARALVTKQAVEAQKLGWQHKPSGRVFAAKPDAFDKIPAPPAAPKGGR